MRRFALPALALLAATTAALPGVALADDDRCPRVARENWMPIEQASGRQPSVPWLSSTTVRPSTSHWRRDDTSRPSMNDGHGRTMMSSTDPMPSTGRYRCGERRSARSPPAVSLP